MYLRLHDFELKIAIFVTSDCNIIISVFCVMQRGSTKNDVDGQSFESFAGCFGIAFSQWWYQNFLSHFGGHCLLP